MKIFSTALIGFVLLMSGVACQNKKNPTSSDFTPTPVRDLKTVYFDFDRANVRDDQADTLLSNSAVLKDNAAWSVTIEGHCDERGTNEYNMALGDRRAQSTKNYLINLGNDPSKLSTVSYGEEKPVGTCHDESCWWQNRRGDFVK